jgi:hypothetical protein
MNIVGRIKWMKFSEDSYDKIAAFGSAGLYKFGFYHA